MAVNKDYYRILNVRSSATLQQIKTAYRKLAMQYHPDKNPDDALAAAIFTDVAEAYKILSDTEARKRYNQERYITAEEEYTHPLHTMETLLVRIQELNTYLKTADPFRINKDALLYSIRQLFPADINILVNTKELQLNQFLEQVSFAADYLSTRQTKQLIVLLQPFFVKHEWLQHKLQMLLSQQQKQENWDRYKVVLALLVAIILCLIIFLAAGK